MQGRPGSGVGVHLLQWQALLFYEFLDAFGFEAALLESTFQLMSIFEGQDAMTCSVTHLKNSFKEISVRINTSTKTLWLAIIEGAFVHAVAGIDHAAHSLGLAVWAQCSDVLVVLALLCLYFKILVEKSGPDRFLARFDVHAAEHGIQDLVHKMFGLANFLVNGIEDPLQGEGLAAGVDFLDSHLTLF